MNDKPPHDYIPNGAHSCACPNLILGSMDPSREDFWQTAGTTSTDVYRAAVEAAEDLALEHGGEWIAWSIDAATGSWGMLHRFGKALPKPTTTATAPEPTAPTPEPARRERAGATAAAPSLFGDR